MGAQKRGSGILIFLVLAVIAIILVIVFYQSRMTSWASTETDTLVRGDRAEMLADSSVQEAMARVRLAVHEKDSEYYKKFRELVYAPNKGEFDLSAALQYPHTAALRSDPNLEKYIIDRPEVRVVSQRQLDKTAYERYGVIRYRGAAHSPKALGRPATRRVEMVQGFKVVLATVPRPFCDYGVFLCDISGLTDLEAINSARDELTNTLRAIWQHIGTARASAPSSVSDLYDELERYLVPEDQAARANPVPVANKAAFYGLQYGGAEMDLAKLHISDRLSDDLAELNSLAAPLQQALNELQNDWYDEAAHEDFIEAALASGRVVGRGLWRIWAFSAAYRVLPSTDEAYTPLAESFYKFEPSFWYRRAQYKVVPRANEEGFGAAWQRFVGDHPKPQGVILFHNTENPITLTGTIRGQCVLITGPAGINLEDLNVADTPYDLLTVVSLGGPVTISGEVHCALILTKAEPGAARSLTIAPDATIVGSILAHDLPGGTELAGLLTRTEKHSSGHTSPQGRVFLDPSYLHVAFSPRALYRKVTRK